VRTTQVRDYARRRIRNPRRDLGALPLTELNFDARQPNIASARLRQVV
jgi:hypothetical protein